MERPWLAATLAALLVSDCGIMNGRPLISQAGMAVNLARGRASGYFETNPQVFTHWRVATPALTMAFLLLHVGLVARARARPTWGRLVLSGVGFGLLIHVYFYYWTAAGLALLLALALDAGHRRVYWHTGWIGGLIGLPALVGDVILSRSGSTDWLQRADKFLPIGRFDELLLPKGPIVLLAVTFVWVRWKRRDLTYLWALIASGLALVNHQVVTRLQIENWHWIHVWGPGLTCMLVLLVVPALLAARQTRAVPSAVLACTLATVAVGLWLRAEEALRTREVVEILQTYREYRAQRLTPSAPELSGNAVVAGDSRFLELAAVLENQRPLAGYIAYLSPSVNDHELDERIALNACLLGLSHAAFAADQRRVLDSSIWSAWRATAPSASGSSPTGWPSSTRSPPTPLASSGNTASATSPSRPTRTRPLAGLRSGARFSPDPHGASGNRPDADLEARWFKCV